MDYCLSKDDIEILQAYVFTQELEVCGYFDVVDNILGTQELTISHESIKEGIKYEDRQACFSLQTEYMFHTHPPSQMSHPSIEDAKLIIERNIKVSVIATRWGIYTIKKKNKDFLKNLKSSGNYKEYIRFIEDVLNNFTNYQLAFGHPKVLIGLSEPMMVDMLNRINSAEKDLQISFHKWDDLIQKEEVRKFKRKKLA